MLLHDPLAVHPTNFSKDKTQKLQNGMASLQKRVAVLEHLCTGSLEDLHIRCYSLEETQTLLAKAVASGSITGGSSVIEYTKIRDSGNSSLVMGF